MPIWTQSFAILLLQLDSLQLDPQFSSAITWFQSLLKHTNMHGFLMQVLGFPPFAASKYIQFCPHSFNFVSPFFFYFFSPRNQLPSLIVTWAYSCKPEHTIKYRKQKEFKLLLAISEQQFRLLRSSSQSHSFWFCTPSILDLWMIYSQICLYFEEVLLCLNCETLYLFWNILDFTFQIFEITIIT